MSYEDYLNQYVPMSTVNLYGSDGVELSGESKKKTFLLFFSSNLISSVVSSKPDLIGDFLYGTFTSEIQYKSVRMNTLNKT